MKHIHPIQVRFADTDALGHINNASYVLYIESARVGFLVDIGLEVTSLVLARLEIDFRLQAKFDAHASFTNPANGMVVESQVEKVGNTSIKLIQRILWKQEIAAEVKTVVVNFDYSIGAPASVSAESRKLLEGYMAE